MKSCAHCSKKIHRSDCRSDSHFADRKFCSRECSAASRRDPEACVMKYCAHCAKEMLRSDYFSDSYFARRKFCSLKCNGASRRNQDASKNCAQCAKEMHRHDYPTDSHFDRRKFCSLRCHGDSLEVGILWKGYQFTAKELAELAKVSVSTLRRRIRKGRDLMTGKKGSE